MTAQSDPNQLLSQLSVYLNEIQAFPDCRITGITFDEENRLGDTACYRSDNGRVVLSRKLFDSILALPEDQQTGCMGMVLKHEAWHSSYSTYWLDKEGTPTQAYLLNHLEDWRNHFYQISYWPSCRPHLNNLYSILDKYRTQDHIAQKKEFETALQECPNDLRQKLQIQQDIKEIWNEISSKSASFNFVEQLDVILSRSWHSTAKQLVQACLPHILNYRNAQPSPYSKESIHNASLAALREAYHIFDILDPYFDFSKEQQHTEGQSIEELIKEVKDEIAKRQAPSGQAPSGQAPSGQAPSGQAPSGQAPSGQAPSGQAPSGQAPSGQAPSGQAPSGQAPSGQAPSGQAPSGQAPSGQAPSGQAPSGQAPSGQAPSGQAPSGQGKWDQYSTSELQELLKTLEELQKQPDNGQGQGQPCSRKDAQNSQNNSKDSAANSGFSPATGGDIAPTTPADKAVYDTFKAENASLIRHLRRMMANAKNNRFTSRSHKAVEGKTGTRLRVRGVVEHLNRPTQDSKLMWQRAGGPAPGRKELVLEDLLIGIDNSGSMSSVLQLTRKVVALICESANNASIPVSIVISTDGVPEALSEGHKVQSQAGTIRKILNLEPLGGTDMARGSIELLQKLRRKTSERKMSRLIVVTDCLTSEEDLQEVSNQSTSIGYPTCVLGLGTSYSSGLEVSRVLPEAALICYDSRKPSEENIYCFIAKFCEWMSDPDSFELGTPIMLSEFRKEIKIPGPQLLKGISLA